MRRAELIASVWNVLEAIEKSKLGEVLGGLLRSRPDRDASTSIMPVEVLDAFQSYSVLSASFGDKERTITGILGLSPLEQSEIWREIIRRAVLAARFRSAVYEAEEFLPKFIKLLEQEYAKEVKSGSEDTPAHLQGKALLTVILPEEHGQFSTAKRVTEIIGAISMLYESFIEIYQETQEPLVILSCDSGSDKSFDFLGVAKAIECVKDIILDVWDRVVLYREHQYAEQGKRISNPIDTTVLGFIQNAKKFKSTTLGRRVGLTFWLLCGRNL